tara:strand:- start:254 stop:571 length:318 start_codon:yes stop_codon:yes gene_type:complete
MHLTENAAQKLKGKFVYYQKPGYAWQFGKVKLVSLYKIGPNKGQVKQIKIATRKDVLLPNGKYKFKDGSIVSKWNGPSKTTTKIFEVLKGKNTWIKFEDWVEKNA